MYEYFSEYTCVQDPVTLNYVMRKRRKPVIVVPTPYFKPTFESERWCYQALMMYIPFRHHSDILRHPAWRTLHERRPPLQYIDADLSHGLPARVVPSEGASVVPTQDDEDVVAALSFEDVTPEVAQQMFDAEFGCAQAPGGEDSGMYGRAIALLRALIGDPAWWPTKYAKSHEILTAINDHLREAYVESNTVPDRADLLEALAEMGVDPDGPVCVEELAAMIAEELDGRSGSHLVNEPGSGVYVGPGLGAALTRHYDACKPSSQRTRAEPEYTDPHEELRTATTQELLTMALSEHREIVRGAGPYATCAERQRVFLSALMGAVIDVIKVDNKIPCPNPQTCRLILQGEAGTGKSFVIKIAVDLCCKYLHPRAVKVFAPTAFAAKAYEDSPCGSSTFASVWRKGYTNEYASTGNAPRKTANMTAQTSSSLRMEMEPVRALI